MIIPTNKNTKTITDMRENAVSLLDQVNRQGLVYILHRSNPRAVLLDIDKFVSMYELLEDFIDNEEALKLSKEPKGFGR
jgi:PHD/YefM family antitoxin component YafN of YafNO toxin-antitoxin module